MASGELRKTLPFCSYQHTVLFVQTKDVYGGSFMYHLSEGDTPLIAVGFVVSSWSSVWSCDMMGGIM